jgi:histidinol-phosphate aminotransferase
MSTIAIRDDIAGLTPYQSFDMRVKARLNTNENPYPISDELAQEVGAAVEKAIKNANRYPSDDFPELKADLIEYLREQEGYAFEQDNILAANGSNEIMDEVLGTFGGPTTSGEGERVCLTFSPSYSMYPQYCRDSFTKFVQVPRSLEDFSIDLPSALEAIEQVRPTIVLIANPNNPTGTFTPVADLVQILDLTQKIDAAGTSQKVRPVVVLDEAYIDFRETGQKTALSLLEKYTTLLVVRTLSKAFSFAGVRCGFAVGSKELIDALKIVRLPYNVSTVTQAVVRTALKHSAKMLEAVDEIKDTRDKLYAELTELNYQNVPLHIIPSGANFIQIGFKNANAADLPKAVHDYLLDKGVQIRVVGPVGYFRVTIGTPEETASFLQYFKEFLTID